MEQPSSSSDGPPAATAPENSATAVAPRASENSSAAPPTQSETTAAPQAATEASDAAPLAGGDAQARELTRIYDGPRPHGYQPMKKQGSIILGIGGDNSDWAVGTWFEGIMTKGYTTDATDAAVQSSIVAAGFGK